MTAPLVISGDAEQAIHVHAQVDDTTNAVNIRISSASHVCSTQHAACRVIFYKIYLKWSQLHGQIEHRANALKAAPGSEPCHRFSRSSFYERFDGLVKYSDPFRVLTWIKVDENAHDAVEGIRVDVKLNGSFSLEPFMIDGLAQLPGFMLNCIIDKPIECIYIAKSFGGVVGLEHLRAGSSVRCYAHCECCRCYGDRKLNPMHSRGAQKGQHQGTEPTKASPVSFQPIQGEVAWLARRSPPSVTICT